MSKAKGPTASAKASSILKQALRNAQQSVKESRAAEKMLRDQKDMIAPLITMLIQLMPDLEVDFTVYGLSFGRVDMNVMLWNAPGFKDERIVAALELLTGMSEESPRTSENAEFKSRSYNFSLPQFKLRVSLSVYVGDDSPTCRRVEVGEETVTRKKYQIVCD